MKVEGTVSGTQTLMSSDYTMKSITPVTRSEDAIQIKQGNEQPKTESVTNKADLETAISKLNDFIEPLRRNLKFELHDKLEKYYVTVIDSNTKEVIKEIPPKKMLDMYAEMADFMGFLIDKKI
ncbi:flagellar protein FlaG [Oceanobacillus damuensis]|uniref:flagellar protein FlaG n=1 Tax=Oceanobacillus damuensis TaxID=937928 RepID=UPI0008353393|nr:flagellar protein FlaG [Oceanobacillus damuensis]